jgi:hypothetical protein
LLYGNHLFSGTASISWSDTLGFNNGTLSGKAYSAG